MIDALVGFVALLRQRGIGVGPDRTLLAALALHHVDLADRSATHRAMRLALVTTGADEALFDELFEGWFTGAPLVELLDAGIGQHVDANADDPGQPQGELRAASAPDAYVDDPSEQVAVTADSDDPDRRRSGDGTSEPDSGEVRAQYDASADIGAMEATDQSVVAERTDDSDPRDGPEIALATGADDDPFDDLVALRQALDDARHDRLALLTPVPAATTPLRSNTLLANPFDDEEQRLLDASVRALWPQLLGAPAWRRRSAPAGQLDLRRTLRSSVVLGGVPAAVRHRAPTTSRPDVLVLVDTSVSMRPFLRLMLHFAHALRRRPGRVRVLGFVAECVDVTDVICHADLPTALGRLLDDAPGGVLDPARPSDYGIAFGSLWHRYARLLRPTTTVLVLGDGRSNGRDPGLPHVTDMTARCGRTVWCTPEPEGAWSFGNAEMAQYAQCVDAAVTIRTLDDLHEAAHSGALGPQHVRRA